MGEIIWKHVIGYEDYHVSNDGQVKSFKRYKEGKFLAPRKDRGGYLFVTLYKNSKGKNFKIHRLVLSTFAPVENMDLLEVNHIDENKQNNNISNLQWMTKQDNLNYGTCRERRAKTLSRNMTGVFNTKRSKKVRCIETNIIYPSISEAERQTGINNSHISEVCKKNKRKTAGGYHWEYCKEETL